MIRKPITVIVLSAALIATAGALAPASAVSAEQVADASTPADHEALAKAYDEEAADARSQANKHRKMAESYAAGVTNPKVTHSGKGAMKLHCERLTVFFESVAQDAEALAALHRQLATQK